VAVEGGSQIRSGETNFDAISMSVFANVFDLYGTLSTDGSVIELSGTIFERTRTNPELLIGQAFAQTVFWQSSEATSKILEKAIAQTAKGKPHRLSLNFRISSDEKEAIELNLVPVLGDGKVSSMFVCGLVLENRIKNIVSLGIAREHLISVAENADIGLWFWDFSDDTIHSTPRCNELFEIPASEQLTFERFIDVVHQNDRRMVKEFISDSRERGVRYSEEFRVQYSDGTVEWIAAEGKSMLWSSCRPCRAWRRWAPWARSRSPPA
jgi:PAS domain-containing protein